MALIYRLLTRNCKIIYNITKPVQWNVVKNYPVRMLSSGVCYQNTIYIRPYSVKKEHEIISVRQYSSQAGNPLDDKSSKPSPDQEKKLGIIKKFKQMYRDYWYVLVPVHICTSIVWFGSFYYAVRSGVDVISILESLGVSETLIEPVKNSGAGYYALAFALYKLATPLRYGVTIGGTTFAIKRLQVIGWIKPVPSRERLKEMFQEKRDNLHDRFNESKQHYQTQMKEKRTQVMEEVKKYKSDMRSIKNKVKRM